MRYDFVREMRLLAKLRHPCIISVGIPRIMSVCLSICLSVFLPVCQGREGVKEREMRRPYIISVGTPNPRTVSGDMTVSGGIVP